MDWSVWRWKRSSRRNKKWFNKTWIDEKFISDVDTRSKCRLPTWMQVCLTLRTFPLCLILLEDLLDFCSVFICIKGNSLTRIFWLWRKCTYMSVFFSFILKKNAVKFQQSSLKTTWRFWKCNYLSGNFRRKLRNILCSPQGQRTQRMVSWRKELKLDAIQTTRHLAENVQVSLSRLVRILKTWARIYEYVFLKELWKRPSVHI